MIRQVNHDGRHGATSAGDLDIAPLLSRTLMFLEHSPRGASRKDILAAMNLHNAVWITLRTALEQSGQVVSVGRGPGLRHVHVRHADQVPQDAMMIAHRAERSQQLDNARVTLREVLQEQGEIDSQGAQAATGLKADPVRRLLLELVDEGIVERTGKKRSTKYRWIG